MIKYKPHFSKRITRSFKELYKIITLLRSKDGCPWDREQKSKDITTSLIGEVYELEDALVNKNTENEKEELGDVLLNTLMLIRIAEEERGIALTDVINDEVQKLYSRHTHVFKNDKVKSAEDALALWNKNKIKEGKTEDKDNYFSRIPSSISPYQRTVEINKKVRKVGFDFKNTEDIENKVREELLEVHNASKDNNKEHLEEECGDLLFSCLSLCTKLKVDPLYALSLSNSKFEKRFNAVYKTAHQKKIEMNKDNYDKLDELWSEVKKQEFI